MMKHGVDIADLEEHKVIIEEKPLIGVEQMPQFPGGEKS
jgi:protein TonB